MQVLEDEEALSRVKEGTVIIRSHGVGRDVYRQLEAQGLTCVDATCPYVLKNSQNCGEGERGRPADHHHRQRKTPGSRGHPGHSLTPVTIIESVQEARFHRGYRFQILYCSQTTFNYNKFKELVEIISKKRYDVIVLNTICRATEERQTEAKPLLAV